MPLPKSITKTATQVHYGAFTIDWIPSTQEVSYQMGYVLQDANGNPVPEVQNHMYVQGKIKLTDIPEPMRSSLIEVRNFLIGLANQQEDI